MANAQEAKRERPLDRGAFLLVYIVGQKKSAFTNLKERSASLAYRRLTCQAIESIADRYNHFLLCFDAPKRTRLPHTTQRAQLQINSDWLSQIPIF